MNETFFFFLRNRMISILPNTQNQISIYLSQLLHFLYYISSFKNSKKFKVSISIPSSINISIHRITFKIRNLRVKNRNMSYQKIFRMNLFHSCEYTRYTCSNFSSKVKRNLVSAITRSRLMVDRRWPKDAFPVSTPGNRK